MMCGGKNGISGCRLFVFSKDIAFASHFMATRQLPPSYPVGVLLALATPVKNYQKWQAIQLAVHSTVGEQINYK